MLYKSLDREKILIGEQVTLQLKAENINLHLKIDSIIKSQENYSYRPIVIAKSNEIKLGEEYIADVRLTVVNKEKPPIVIIGNSSIDSTWKFFPNGDSLVYNPYYETSTYKSIPKKTGTFKWEGEIISNIPGQKYPFPFTMTYNVK